MPTYKYLYNNINMRVFNNSFTKKYGWLIFVSFGLSVSVLFYILGSITASQKLVVILCVIGILPELKAIAKDLWNKRFGVDIIAVVAVLSSLALQEYATAGVILLMFTGGTALEEYAKSRAQKELNSLLSRVPKIAHVKRGKEFVNVSVEKINPNDTLLIKPGEVAPVDGTIISGDSSFDESAITGESLPIDKQKNDLVLSGTINQDSPVQIRAVRSSGDSQYGQIIELVRSAASSKSPIVRLADAYSVPFTIIAFCLAAIAWFISGDPVRALAVLVVATPCPLIIATPVAIVSGMSRAAHLGIIIKDGASLEKLAMLKVLAFDKTGTLTQNKPTIATINPDGISDAKLLKLAASVEQDSNHILAGVVVAEARRRHIILVKPDEAHEVVGGGISAKFGSKDIHVGKLSFLAEFGVRVPKQESKSVKTTMFIAEDKKFLGSIVFADPIRTNALNTLKRLKSLGINKTLMLTGDKEGVAKTIAQEVGISDVHASLLPVDKLHVIEEYTARKKVIGMVGDGVNDAPTLAAADVGIALGAKGSTAASESADVVIMLDDLSKVADAISVAKRSVLIAKQSILVGIGLSIVLMIFATLGKIPPLYGAILQEVVDVAVILNALRAHLKRIA